MQPAAAQSATAQPFTLPFHASSSTLPAKEPPRQAQLADRFDNLVRYLAGDELTPLVLQVFPGAEAATYVLTRPERRHAWNAYVTLHALDVFTQPGAESRELQRQFLQQSNRNLLVAAYGSSPRGLERLLSRLPETALSPKGYAGLAKLCQRAADAGTHLGHLGPLDDDKLAALHELPVALWRVCLLRSIQHRSSAKLVADAYRSLTKAGLDEGEVANAILRPKTWKQRANVLRRLYEELPPPQHPLPLEGSCRPLRTAREMREAAGWFRNCVANMIPDFLRGERAYAVWTGDHSPVLIELRRDAPLGWSISEMKGPHNAEPSTADREAILQQLARRGIFEQPLFEYLVRDVWRSAERDAEEEEIDFEEFQNL